jgi:hypothetical protein
MRPSDSEIPNLTGQLLVAHPNLRDPNVRKTVLFLSAHDSQQGARWPRSEPSHEQEPADFLPDHELDALG